MELVNTSLSLEAAGGADTATAELHSEGGLSISGLSRLSNATMQLEVLGDTHSVEFRFEGRLDDDLSYAEWKPRDIVGGGESVLVGIDVAAMTDLRITAVNQDASTSADVRIVASGGV
jgi:hypothetical protein